MKFLVISTIALFSSAVMASPSVGDSANYVLAVGGIVIIQKVELTAFNPSTQAFTQVETTEFQGQIQKETSQIPASELLSDAQTEQLLANCASYGGALESVVTQFGNLETCALTDSGSIVNIGRVPFGVVQIRSAEVSGQIVGFKRGN